MRNPLRWLRNKMRRRVKRRGSDGDSSIELQVAEAIVDHEDGDFAEAMDEANELDDATEAAERDHRPILGSWQQERAQRARWALKPVDSTYFGGLIVNAESKDEEDYLHKALAAGHSVAEIEVFADRIRGKDEEWLRDNLTLTGTSSGGGLRQQFENSCTVTTVQALRGEIDPIYSLKIHDENPNLSEVDEDPMRYNPRLAIEQRQLLERPYLGMRANGEAPVAHAQPLSDEEVDSEARVEIDDLLDELAPSTGVRYVPLEVGYDAEIGPVLDDMDNRLRMGLPVPISVGTDDAAGHALLVVGLTNDKTPAYMIYEPTEGIIVIRTRAQFLNGELDFGSDEEFTSVDLPMPLT